MEHCLRIMKQSGDDGAAPAPGISGKPLSILLPVGFPDGEGSRDVLATRKTMNTRVVTFASLVFLFFLFLGFFLSTAGCEASSSSRMSQGQNTYSPETPSVPTT